MHTLKMKYSQKQENQQMLKRKHDVYVCSTQKIGFLHCQDEIRMGRKGFPIKGQEVSQTYEKNTQKQPKTIGDYDVRKKAYRGKNGIQGNNKVNNSKNQPNATQETLLASSKINKLGKYKQKQPKRQETKLRKQNEQKVVKVEQSQEMVKANSDLVDQTQSTCCQEAKSSNGSNQKFNKDTNLTVIKSVQCLQALVSRKKVEKQDSRFEFCIFKQLYYLNINSFAKCTRQCRKVFKSIQKLFHPTEFQIQAMRIIIFSKIIDLTKQKSPSKKRQDLLIKFQGELEQAIQKYLTHKWQRLQELERKI